jgi:hypothetical protein
VLHGVGNIRFVLHLKIHSMRSIGKGAEAAKMFCGIMDMPAPPGPNGYHHYNKALLKTAVLVAEKTDRAAEICGNSEGISHSVQCLHMLQGHFNY